jgi:hypothetical protein
MWVSNKLAAMLFLLVERIGRKPSFRQYSYLDVWGIFPGRAAAKEIPQACVDLGPTHRICEFAAFGQQEAGVLLESPL